MLKDLCKQNHQQCNQDDEEEEKEAASDEKVRRLKAEFDDFDYATHDFREFVSELSKGEDEIAVDDQSPKVHNKGPIEEESKEAA